MQGLFRESLPEKPDSSTLLFLTECREILCIPRKNGEYNASLLNPRMGSALVCPVYRELRFQGLLFLNSLYENHYGSKHIKILEEHCRIDRLRILSLQEVLP